MLFFVVLANFLINTKKITYFLTNISTTTSVENEIEKLFFF